MSFLFTKLLHHLSPHYVDYYYFYSRSTTAAVSQPLERIWSICFSQRLLTNLEDEIFLKGGSVVTPQNFDLIFYLLKFGQEVKLFHLSRFTLLLL